MNITETKEGVKIDLHVKPRSPKFRISTTEEEIVIHSTEEPVKGRVNKQIIKELSKLFHAKIEITHGSTSRQKQILIKDVKKTYVAQLLEKQNQI
jgi:uncharacterized protein